MDSAPYECRENGRAMAHCERQKLRHRLWDFCAREMRRLDSLETSKEECRSKSGLTQAFENSCPTAVRARLYMLGLGGYGSGPRIRPARAFIGSPYLTSAEIGTTPDVESGARFAKLAQPRQQQRH